MLFLVKPQFILLNIIKSRKKQLTSAATSKTHSNLLGYQAFICFLNCICLHLHLISSRPILGFAKILAVMNIHSHPPAPHRNRITVSKRSEKKP